MDTKRIYLILNAFLSFKICSKIYFSVSHFISHFFAKTDLPKSLKISTFQPNFSFKDFFNTFLIKNTKASIKIVYFLFIDVNHLADWEKKHSEILKESLRVASFMFSKAYVYRLNEGGRRN